MRYYKVLYVIYKFTDDCGKIMFHSRALTTDDLYESIMSVNFQVLGPCCAGQRSMHYMQRKNLPTPNQKKKQQSQYR